MKTFFELAAEKKTNDALNKLAFIELKTSGYIHEVFDDLSYGLYRDYKNYEFETLQDLLILMNYALSNSDIEKTIKLPNGTHTVNTTELTLNDLCPMYLESSDFFDCRAGKKYLDRFHELRTIAFNNNGADMVIAYLEGVPVDDITA